MKNILLILSFIGFSAVANAQSLNLDAISKTKLNTIEMQTIQGKGFGRDITVAVAKHEADTYLPESSSNDDNYWSSW